MFTERELPSLPTGVLPNSEVVTNVVLDVDFVRIKQSAAAADGFHNFATGGSLFIRQD